MAHSRPDPPAPNRTRILQCATQNPGAHLRDLARRTPAALGTMLYHLDRLERDGDLVVRRDGRYKRYFAANAFDAPEKKLLSALRHHVPCEVVFDLLTQPPATQKELCGRVGVSRSTLSFYATKLVADGILQRDATRPEGIYSLMDAGLVAQILARFGPSLRGGARPTGPVRNEGPALAGGT